MAKFRVPKSRNQLTLLPRSVEEFVPKDDLARYVDGLVSELDLSEIENSYSEEGRRGFSPDVMVKLLVYGKMRGIRSSRSLAQARWFGAWQVGSSSTALKFRITIY